ncbi:MAG: hypothetical protein ABI608_02730 [Rhizomicrobium sp.]
MMKFPLYLLAALALGACTGPEGNPGGQPYADQPGGMIAVRPEPVAATSYDPYAPQKAYDGMQYGPPPAAPMPPLTPQPIR